LEIERILQYGLVLPVLYIILLIVKSIFVIGRKGPTGLSLSGLGITFTVRSGCVHFDPNRPDNCNLEIIHQVSKISNKEETS
jgi:hypothetical protein